MSDSNEGVGLDPAGLESVISGIMKRAQTRSIRWAQSEHLQWFKWEHLTGRARTVSQKFAALAADVAVSSSDAQAVLALEHLLIAKDAAVRAAIAADRADAQAVPEHVEPESERASAVPVTESDA